MPTDKSAADPDRIAGPRSRPTTRPVGGVESVTITHPDRIVFPDGGHTKQDVADYYTRVMKWVLPGIVDRPTSVIRCPEGTTQACFFQKHMIQGLKHVGKKKLKEESGVQATYIYPLDAESVIELVQFGTLEFHPWGATVAQPDKADRVVFDLDPGPGVVWGKVASGARLLRKLLQRRGLASYLRTTGGKGLHVVLPLNPPCPWPQVKKFARAFAESVAEAHPLEFVATASKARRGGKIYLDYLRNSRGATSVASYSLRARPGAPVAMPLRWNELGRLRSGHDFDIESAPRRLARLRSDPWKGLDTLKQSLDSGSGRHSASAPASSSRRRA
ncbi:MAG TPA: non-homologous end-joining DNA ligase [Rhodanobacter sp.]|nr:non-homologous end-joining DNA ligase [Rhodanobacter sp.]